MATILDITNKVRLSNFINKNKDRIYEKARYNTNLNKENKPTISKDDDTFDENVWDEHYKT